jgi:hypothetical protein
MTRSVAIIMVGGPTKGKLLLCYGYAAIQSKLDLDHSLSQVRRMQVSLPGESVSCESGCCSLLQIFVCWANTKDNVLLAVFIFPLILVAVTTDHQFLR